ncbi:MAG: hypothetical protein NVS3B3_17900 [Aquirhabdus sp.]
MKNTSEVLQFKPEYHAIHTSKTWLQRHCPRMLRTLFGLMGLVVLVGFGSVVWVATRHGDAQFKIGQLYENGSKLIPQNYTKAFAWYGDAAAKGDTNAQLKLAEMYNQGKGIHQDLSEALARYRQLADQGNANAQYRLAEMYLAGQGADRNIELGVKLLEKCANQGNADAAFKLGVIYAGGLGADSDEKSLLSDAAVVYNSMREGVSQDYKRSAMWYLKAATQGHADAQAALGMLYFSGNGVQPNPLTAHVLLAIAAARGSIQAPNWRSQVISFLSEDQIVEAQPFIDHWVVGQPIIFTE